MSMVHKDKDVIGEVNETWSSSNYELSMGGLNRWIARCFLSKLIMSLQECNSKFLVE